MFYEMYNELLTGACMIKSESFVGSCVEEQPRQLEVMLPLVF